MKKLMLILCLISTSVYAGNPHHTIEESKTSIKETTIYNIEDRSSLAMAMGQHHFDYGTYATQKSISAALLEGREAVSAAFAKRDCKKCGLISGSVAIDTVGNLGIGLGYTWSY